MSLAVENILGIIDRDGEEELALDLSSFSCGVNDEIQTFLTDKAIEVSALNKHVVHIPCKDYRISEASNMLCKKAKEQAFYDAKRKGPLICAANGLLLRNKSA